MIRSILDDAKDYFSEGSFFRVLNAYNGPADKHLVEQVNQVRKYRNWVSHGRRGRPPDANVEPRDAYERLQKFLAVIGPM